MYWAKPTPGAWKLRKRSSASLALRKPWTTPGGIHASVPDRQRPRLALRPEPQGELALEHVEQVGVLAVDVQVGAVAARPEARPRGVQAVVAREDLDPAGGRVADDLAAARRYDGDAHAMVGGASGTSERSTCSARVLRPLQ